MPPQRLHQVIPLVRGHCDRCHEPLPPQPGPDDPEPSWHQVAELPALAAVVTEYQGHYRTCRGCGHLNHAAIPQHLKAHRVGQRLAAKWSGKGDKDRIVPAPHPRFGILYPCPTLDLVCLVAGTTWLRRSPKRTRGR